MNKIIVRAEGGWGDSTVEVMANGETKGTVYVPGRDPSYIVTIAETASSLEFRNVGGHRVHIFGGRSL